MLTPLLLVVMLVLTSGPALATTYYVATTGNNSNPGTQASPWAHPQKCAQAPIAPGDTCLVGNGTYTDTFNNNGLVVYIHTVNGTLGSPITIKSLNPLGAHIVLPGVNCNPNCSNTGFHVASSYYVIDGFEISGGTGTLGNVGHAGIFVTGSGTGTTIQNNKIHDIARTVCSASGIGFTGIFIGAQSGPMSNITIDRNKIYSIGRLRGAVGFQENGCTLTAGGGGLDQNDHGIYVDAFTNGLSIVTISRNLCYDTTRGECLQFYSGSPPAGMTTTVHVWNNTFADGTPETFPSGQVTLSSPITNIDFKNNIFYQPKNAAFTWSTSDFSTRCSGVTYAFNLSDNADADMFSPAPVACITSGGNNLVGSSTINFTNAAARDYSLAAGSAAINSGTDVGLGGCNGVCDRGYLESSGGADVTAPTTPGTPVVTPVSSSQLTLAWNASTDNVAVTGYRIERCTGIGCSNFVQIGTSVSPIYADSGLLSSTIYLYRVRATDAAGNLSTYSVTATTSLTPPSAPTGLLISSIR